MASWRFLVFILTISCPLSSLWDDSETDISLMLYKAYILPQLDIVVHSCRESPPYSQDIHDNSLWSTVDVVWITIANPKVTAHATHSHPKWSWLISPAIIILASLGPRIGLACSKQSDKSSGIQCPRKLIWRMINRSEATQYSRRIRCSANAPDTFETVTRTGKRLICK